MYKKRLLELGIPASIKGFEYLNFAIEIYVPTQRIARLYDDVAMQFKTTQTGVERAMRHAITKTKDDLPVGKFVAKYKILWED